MPTVEIAIDIRRMAEFGVGTYIRKVVRTLGRLDRENQFLLIESPARARFASVRFRTSKFDSEHADCISRPTQLLYLTE
jgi:hypothetical protein